MPLLDIFKKKEEKKENEEKKQALPQPSKEKTKREIKKAPFILKSAHVTEKAAGLTKGNQYVFKVFSGANKQEIKKAIEEVYGVDVLRVRTIKMKRKKRRLAKTSGWKKGYKKAIVSLKKGQEIEILPR